MPDTTPLHDLENWLNQHIIGQQALTRRLLICLLADGHLLVEGMPGLAKTTAIKTLALGVQADFQRIQFTPDLLPSDLTGSDRLQPNGQGFAFQAGPLFSQLVLADEINRAPAKVQSALLEAMGEQQISIGMTTHKLPDLFMVMATQNPIEQEGTYPLPEAQLDRFLMQVLIDYPDADQEQAILRCVRQQQDTPPPPCRITPENLLELRQQAMQVPLAESLERYLVELVITTRQPERHDATLAEWLVFGASPRATIALDRCCRIQAWLEGRDYVSPDDIHALAHDILRHRIVLRFEAEAEGISRDQAIDRLLAVVPTP